ncbi:MAG: peptide ABC transporter permease [Melioribacteraceae bacterium]|nr:MAG: peptide ABC transporter permease [Melioribacteraceae bacterium]
MVNSGLKIISRRALSSIALLLIVVSLVFIVVILAPGNPATRYMSSNLSPQLIELIEKEYSFKGNIAEQYFAFMGRILTGNFGYSTTFKTPVISVIIEYLRLTVLLSLIAFIIQSLSAVVLVYISYTNKRTEKVFRNITFIMFTIPAYVTGLLLILLFSVFAGIFPVSGLPYRESAGLFGYISHLTLPVITLAVPGIALFYNYLHSTVAKTAKAEYITFVRSLGLSEKEIFLRHILPNSVIPLLSIVAIEIGFLLSGSLIIEVLFSLPGFGKLTFTAFLDRDYPLIIGTTLLSAFFMIFANFLADLVKYYFDKRYRELI